MSYISFHFPNIANVRCCFQMRIHTKNDELSESISYECSPHPQEVLDARVCLYKECGIASYMEVKQVHGIETTFSAPIYSIKSEGIMKADLPEHSSSFTNNTQDVQLYTDTRYNALLHEADGIGTDKENIALMIKTADCQPILLAHHSGKYILALHSGWRGNAQNYIQKAVAEFCSTYSISSQDISAVRGPSLSPAKAEFVNASKEWGKEFMQFFNTETQCMNLWEITQFQLMQAGISEQNIYGIDFCTYSSKQFFSYRRNNNTGRQASFIIIDKNT